MIYYRKNQMFAFSTWETLITLVGFGFFGDKDQTQYVLGKHFTVDLVLFCLSICLFLNHALIM